MPESQPSGLARKLLVTGQVFAVLTLGALTVLFASAGVLLQDQTGLNIHSASAITLHILTGLLALTLALHAWVARTGIWAAATAAVVFGLTFGQAGLGSNTTLAFHIVGALVIVVLCTGLTIWALRTNTSPTRTAPS